VRIVRKTSEGVEVDFERDFKRPRGRWGRWVCRLRFRVRDDSDLFLCPWLTYYLSGFGGCLGYTCAAWSRERLIAKTKRKEKEVLASLCQR
jgi:hypothetical protein